MRFLRAATWQDALVERAGHRRALPVAGGTDVMIRLSHDEEPPDAYSTWTG